MMKLTDAEIKKTPIFLTWAALWNAIHRKGFDDVHMKNLIDDFAWAVTEKTKAEIFESRIASTDFFDVSVQDYFPAWVISESSLRPTRKPIHRKKKESVK